MRLYKKCIFRILLQLLYDNLKIHCFYKLRKMGEGGSTLHELRSPPPVQTPEILKALNFRMKIYLFLKIR